MNGIAVQRCAKASPRQHWQNQIGKAHQAFFWDTASGHWSAAHTPMLCSLREQGNADLTALLLF